MDLLLGLVMMVCGVMTLVKREIRLSASRIARGVPAVLTGLLLTLALPAAFLVQLGLGLLEQAGTRIVGEPARGLLTYAVLAGAAVVAVVVAFLGTRTSGDRAS